MEETRKRIQAHIQKMTLEEKVLALTGSSMFKQTAVTELGLGEIYYLDGGTGANYAQMVTDCFYRIHVSSHDASDEMIFDASGIAENMLRLQKLVLGQDVPANSEEQAQMEEFAKAMEAYVPNGDLPGCFPPGIILGSGWDPQSIYEMGEALGKEADYFKIDVLLGTPNVNIQRDPLGGRAFEGYSEDPCLTAKLAPNLVRGVQSQGIAANAKHFAANNQETNRRTVNEHIPVRALHEIYFPGFKACVQEGGCKTVMSAYNKINGYHCAMNPWLLTHILRERWGFEGFVVSDWSGAFDQVEAFQAGNDVDMPGPRRIDAVIDAVHSGKMDESVLDQSLERLWMTLLSLPCCKDGHKQKTLDREGSRQAAYNSIREGLILLKNEASALPLAEGCCVSVYGAKSKNPLACGSGSASVITKENTNLFDSLVACLGAEHVLDRAVTEQTDAVIVTVGTNGQEGFDRKNLDIDAEDITELQEAIRQAKAFGKKVIVIINACGPVDLSAFLSDIDGLLCAFIPGMEGGRACADALLGRFNPSGKLPITFPKRYTDCPTCGNFPGWNEEVWYGEGIFVGYRHYDYRDIEPLFPFGFGLSYTSFQIKDAVLSADTLQIEGDAPVTLSVTVENTGSMEGKEVVQIYVGADAPTMVKPVKELKDFQKVSLKPGQSKTVSFQLRPSQLASFDTQVDDWTVEPGLYHIYIGNSSRSIAQQLSLQVEGFDPYGFNANTVMGDLAYSQGALEALHRFCPNGKLTVETIRAGILYQPSGTLEDYWNKRVAPEMSGTPEEKDAIYQQMLRAINRFK